MRINIYHISITLGILLTSTSCKDFLTVSPKTEISRDDLFSSEKGFQDALAGVYIKMGEDGSYGKELTMTSMEHLVSSWEVAELTPEGQLGRFNYSDAAVELKLQNIFNRQYTAVASINIILEELDNRRGVLKPGMYELIKGECLALRGFLHFDMLRLFGPSAALSTSNDRLPPYVKVFSKIATPSGSYADFKTALFNDLTEAEQLLSTIDPFLTNSIDDFKNGTFKTKDNFNSYRYLRMNYYAVKALKARAYLWYSDNVKAYEEAIFIINTKNENGSNKFALGLSADYNSQNFVLTNEQIFGLYDFNLSTKFVTPTLFKGTDGTLVNTQLYGDNIGTDIRSNALWVATIESSVSRYNFKKYQVSGTSASLLLDYKQIPMFRISEMYLIAIECGSQSDAQALWDIFRNSRGLAQSLPSDMNQKQDLLLKEYRREFYGEGQAFYAYKRMNAELSKIIFAPSNIDVNYTPPLPTTEITLD